MTRITKASHPDLHAYNECVDALNGFEAEITELVRKRDSVWIACEAICGTGRHGANQSKRNFTVRSGYVQR